jgi:hypothetical protein
MPTIPARLIRFPVLAVSSVLLLSACGGGNSGPDPVATSPDPVQPGPTTPPSPPEQPSPPTQPGPNTPADPAPEPEPVLAATYTGLGDDTTQPAWNAWVAPPNRATVSGVGCLANENFHQHSLVSIYRDGVRLGLPDNIGRGGCASAYELHTHDTTGVVHIETDVPKKFTLGQFFALWKQPLGANGTAGLGAPVRFYLIANEKLTRYTGDPATLELVAHREIVIIGGTAPAVLPKYRWPAGL